MTQAFTPEDAGQLVMVDIQGKTLDAATGTIVRDAHAVKPGQRLKTRLKRGEVLSRVDAG